MRFLSWPFWVWPMSIAGVVLMFGAVSWLPRFTTSAAPYCLSCHATGETQNVSAESLVHPPYTKVGCTECHAKPGQFVIVNIYREGVFAEPEKVSANCLRCHKQILSNEQANFKLNSMEIRIPHEFHVKAVGVSCTLCHQNIAHDYSENPTNRPRMEYCFTCHSPATSSGDFCLKCHQKGIPSPTSRGQDTLKSEAV